MPPRPVPEKFHVAFSFAGEHRDFVRSLAEAVENLLGPATVFYDEWYEYYITGADGDIRLQTIYEQNSIMVVPCMSAQYAGKPWTSVERRAVAALQAALDAAIGDKTAQHRILPLRVGEGDVPGFPRSTIFSDARGKPVEQTAELILAKLRLIEPTAGRTVADAGAANTTRYIHLAEGTLDMDDQRRRMQAFLQELGWTVLSPAEYEEKSYDASLEADLQKSLAYVQLLGPYPWKRGDYDRRQNDAATRRGLPRFRYRSSEIDLATVDEKHRAFLTAPDVIATGFEDFKAHLRKELAALAQKFEAAARGNSGAATDDAPLIAVAMRCANPDLLWSQVYQWIYGQQQITPYQLRPDEKFQIEVLEERVRGFLVVCDGTALEDGPNSPRDYIEQCRLLQMKEKKAARQPPPFGLAYWPPPAEAWPRLLKSFPLELSRINGEAPDTGAAPNNLAEFFNKVRKVAS